MLTLCTKLEIVDCVPCEPKTAFAKAMWIAKSVVSCNARDRSLDAASCEAKIISDCKTISVRHRAKPRLSREAKAKALMCAKSIADSASFPLTVLSAKKILSRETKIKALSAKDLSREVKN